MERSSLAWVIIVIAIVISVIVMTQKPILAPIHEKTNDHRRMAEERRQERLARQAAMEEEEGKELILEPVEEPKKAGKKKKSRLLSHVESKADLNENDDTHQMEMPELSIHRGSVPAEEPEKTEPEMTRQASEEAKKEKTSADHTRNPRSSCEEIEADVDGIRQEIWKKAEEKRPEYKTPPMNLLKKGTRGAMGDSDAHLREVARKLEETLDSFGVKVTVNNVSCGPTVTRYELMPEQGVKVSRIVGLTDDIKLSLAAADVRIEAPIPGKSAVGIEVPNKTNTAVMLRDLLETPEFKNFSSNLAFAVGKDIAGQPVIADIAKMPHLLIAGATGSGKSVCINTIIMSILYKAHPDDVKLIMIDPKVVELSVYNGIPHLFIPVVTDPKKASGALNWAVAEMTDRYNKFAEFNVRDMKGYNAKVAELPPDEMLFWLLCRAVACLCMARLTLWLGQKLGNLLAALFVSAVGYCLPALLALSGMSNGIEWLGFYPLFHAAALCQTQGTNAAGAPYNLLWVPIFLVVVAAALAWAIGNDLTEAYEWAGVALDAL